MLHVPAAIFAGLLIVTGMAKAIRPTDTAKALSQLGMRGGVPLVRILSIAEIGLGVWVLVTMDPVALFGQGALYLVFGIWVALAIRLDVPMASCGCLGRDDTPPYWGHLVVNVVAVGVSLAAVGIGGSWLSAEPLEVMTILVVVPSGVFLAWSVLGEAARVDALASK